MVNVCCFKPLLGSFVTAVDGAYAREPTPHRPSRLLTGLDPSAKCQSQSQIPALPFPPRRPTPHDEGRNGALPCFLLVSARAGLQRASGRGARRRRALKQGSALICSSLETSLAPGWVRSAAGVENPPRGCGCPGGRAWRGEEAGLWPGAAGRQMTEGNGQIQGRPRFPPLPALGAGRRMRLLYVGHGLQRGEALRGREEIPARRSPRDKQGTDG